MSKQQYTARVVIRSVALLAFPRLLYLAVIGYFFPPQGFWAWFGLITAKCATWVLFLAGVAQLTASSLPQWLGWDVLQILGSFERTAKRTLNGVRDMLSVLNHESSGRKSKWCGSMCNRDVPCLLQAKAEVARVGLSLRPLDLLDAIICLPSFSMRVTIRPSSLILETCSNM